MPPVFESRQRRVAARVRHLLAGVADASADVPGPANSPGGPDVEDARADVTRRGALAVGAAVVLVAVITAVWVLAGRPRSDAMRPDPPPSNAASMRASPPPTAPSARSSSAVVVVDVVGKVRRPGVYRLPAGARVDDAVRAAGGFSGPVTGASVNLAARLSDGQQVLVGVAPVAGAVPAGSASSSGGDGGGGAVASGAPVDLNTASSSELEALPGVGPVLAQHILDWRAAHGSFTAVDQLRSVSGIGPAKFAVLRPLVVV